MMKKTLKDKIWTLTYYPRITWYHILVIHTKVQRYFGIRKDTSVIPEGVYCYTIDEEKNKTHPINGYWIKTCKYYKSMNGEYAACTYVGFIGLDMCLGDQCKICSENYGDERDPLIIERESKIKKIINRKKNGV